jgi:hypothetical protein
MDPPVRKAPLHERIRLLGWLRGKFRSAFFRYFAKLVQTDDARMYLQSTLQGCFRAPSPALSADALAAVPPYPNLGLPEHRGRTANRDDVIIITARFRSGSTLLWNLFRNMEGCTSYYEPFNERRWFDPQTRGRRMDPTHRKAEEYWREYEGLQILGQYFREEWNDRHLFMDAQSWDPAMKRYIELLIEHARGRPVLQFNRLDFRLPWIRHYFPRAKILHLFRHPRDQWCSSLVNPAAFPKEGTMADFAQQDSYYLRTWARDLRNQFPFLDEKLIAHPYQMFFLLWKLSFLYGRCFAHHSIAYEDLVTNPDHCLTELFRKFSIDCADRERLKQLIEKPPLARWRSYAEEAWFQAHEAQSETTLTEFFAISDQK